MAISVVQTATGTGNPPCIFGSNITLGNTVILIAPCYNTSGSNNTITAVKIGTNTIPGTFACFNNGGTGTVNSASSGGNVASLAVWVIPNIQVSSQTNVDYTPSGSQVGQVAFEVSGLGTSPTLDQSASGSGITTGSVTTGATGAITGAPELIVGGSMIFAGATGAPSGFTTSNPTGDCWAGYQIATVSGGTYTWTQTGNGNPWATALATILGTPSAPPPIYVLVRAPWRPAPPPVLLPAQVITAPLPAPPSPLTGIVQSAGLPFRPPWAPAPQVITSAAAPVTLGSASLSGVGSLTAAPVLTGSATLSGLGTLTAVTTTGTTASLSGAGTLTALWTLQETLALSGSGTLSVSQGAGSANLSGLGTLTAAPGLQGAVSLSGLGTLSAVQVLSQTVTLSGLGNLSVPPPFQVARSTPSVADPRDGTNTVTALATSSPGVT